MAYRFNEYNYGYEDFYNSVDCVIMGSNTYKKCLEFTSWPYKDKECFVISSFLKSVISQVELFSNGLDNFISMLKKKSFKKVWLVGGGALASSFQQRNLITIYIIYLMPIILGSGISIFDTDAKTAY